MIFHNKRFLQRVASDANKSNENFPKTDFFSEDFQAEFITDNSVQSRVVAQKMPSVPRSNNIMRRLI